MVFLELTSAIVDGCGCAGVDLVQWEMGVVLLELTSAMVDRCGFAGPE